MSNQGDYISSKHYLGEITFWKKEIVMNKVLNFCKGRFILDKTANVKGDMLVYIFLKSRF